MTFVGILTSERLRAFQRSAPKPTISVTDTHIVVNVLTTNVEQSMAEVTINHLQTVVEAPQGSGEGVTDTGETTTRSRVRFEHDERLLVLLGQQS